MVQGLRKGSSIREFIDDLEKNKENELDLDGFGSLESFRELFECPWLI